MRITLIAAFDLGMGIGHEGQIPWRLPADLRRFKDLSMGKAVVMGRKTHQSIGKALPGRLNVVLSRDPAYQPAPECWKHASLRDALDNLEIAGHREVVIAGGEDVYLNALQSRMVDTLYLTQVFGIHEADAYFPGIWTWSSDWQVTVEGHGDAVPAQDGKPSQPAYTFLRCDRVVSHG